MLNPPAVAYARLLAIVYVASISVILSMLGCGGGGGGGTITPPPPPPTISLKLIVADKPAVGAANWVPAGIPGFTLLANGTGFTSTSVVEWNGSALPTQFGTSTDLSATVSSTLLTTPGTVQVKVSDPASGATSGVLSFGVASPAAATASVVQMITVAPDGTPADADSLVAPSISTTGRYIAFQSVATNLGAGVTSGYQQIYERDTCIGAPVGCTPTTIPISVTYDGSPVNGHSRDSSISGDGRYVAFDASASNILNFPESEAQCRAYAGAACVFVRDTCIGAPAGCQPKTTLISSTLSGQPAGGANPSISLDGRFVAFSSTGTAPGTSNVYLTDTCNGGPSGCTPGVVLVSQSSTGAVGNANSYREAVPPGGRFILFASYANNLIPNDTSIWSDFFLRDTCIGAPVGCVSSTQRVSVATDGTQGNYGVYFLLNPAISSDGRYLAMSTGAENMVPGFPVEGVILRDTCFGAPSGCTPTTSFASVGNDGAVPNMGEGEVSMSASGRFIAFPSLASNLVPGDTFGPGNMKDIFVRDTCIGAPSGCLPSTVRVSVTNVGGFATQANAPNDYPQISGDGHYIVFLSASTNYLASGGNGHQMVYLAKTGF